MDRSVSSSAFVDRRLGVPHRNSGALAAPAASSPSDEKSLSRSIQSIVGLLLDVMLLYRVVNFAIVADAQAHPYRTWSSSYVRLRTRFQVATGVSTSGARRIKFRPSARIGGISRVRLVSGAVAGAVAALAAGVFPDSTQARALGGLIRA